MPFTFKCSSCKTRQFFAKIQEGMCQACYTQEQKRQEQEKKLQERARKKEQRRIKRERELNAKLKEELLQEAKNIQGVKVTKTTKKQTTQENTTILKPSKTISLEGQVNQPLSIPLEKQAEILAKKMDSLLYVYADVKRIKAIEWKQGKKRIALNKEREIRHTHKGGWSQEKFQRFVDSQKAKTWDWIEDNLSRKGVLRTPYEQIIIDADEKIKSNILSLLEK